MKNIYSGKKVFTYVLGILAGSLMIAPIAFNFAFGQPAQELSPLPTQPVDQGIPPAAATSSQAFGKSVNFKPGLPLLKYAYAAVDPSPGNNPSGATFPGYRGANQVVIYTPAFGEKTNTNTFGAEAVVIDGVVQSVGCCDSDIPRNGYIISGHGAAGLWIKERIQPGMAFGVDSNAKLVMFQNTPEALIQQARAHISDLRKSTQLGKAEIVEPDFQEAEQCIASLESSSVQLNARLPNSDAGNISNDAMKFALQEIRSKSLACQQSADAAYVKSVKAYPEEFRGIWLRPLERTPEKIGQALDRLKLLGIKDVFIETYYQGKTIYPSQVMANYGLPPQHPRFQGSDPLKLWIDLAHQRGLRVHAWSQIFFAGNKEENAEQFGPILNQYPQWTNIERSALCPNTTCNVPLSESALKPVPSDVEPGHYFLDPSNPEVRTYLKKLLTELVSNYDVDGLNYDYIRYPAAFPTQSGHYLQSNWGYTMGARKSFMELLEKEDAEKIKSSGAKTGSKIQAKPNPLRFDPARLSTASALWPRWVDWRKQQITSFVKESSAELKQVKPNLKLTAVTFPLKEPQSLIKLQDWPTWVKEGYLDALTPIGLYPTPEGIYHDSEKFKQLTAGKVPVYVGIFGAYNRLSPADLVAQIDAAHQAGMPGIMIFEHSRLSEPYREALQSGPFRE